MLDGSVNPRDMNLAEAERNKLSPYRAFYALTLGGAQALYLDDRIGNFEPGKEADFVVLDWTAGQRAVEWQTSRMAGKDGPKTVEVAANLLFAIMTLGDDRSVDETWIMGEQAYTKKSATKEAALASR
jgi:guanine deaminase